MVAIVFGGKKSAQMKTRTGKTRKRGEGLFHMQKHFRRKICML